MVGGPIPPQGAQVKNKRSEQPAGIFDSIGSFRPLEVLAVAQG